MKHKINLVIVIFFYSQFIILANPPDDPITPADMKNMIGRGFDVSWAEFTKSIEGYGVDEVIALKERGFKNVRVRTGLPADNELLKILDNIIEDCLEHNIIPILAYNAKDYEENPSNQNLVADSLWWAKVADHFKNTSHKLIFDLNIEWSLETGKDPDLVNNWYKVVTPGIRGTNPTRIIVYSPIKLSSPEYLTLLKIPSSAGTYVMAEWHLYAAGPSDDPSSPKFWSTGTYEQRKVIIDKINIGAAWEVSTGIKTWVGAWMAGNYNKGNTFSVVRQAEFATFMVSEFEMVGVPWSINAMHHFYDYYENKWIDSMLVVLNVLSPVKTQTPFLMSTDSVTLEGNILVFNGDNEIREILIYDMNGNIVKRTETKNSNFIIKNDELKVGVYAILVLKKSRIIFSTKYISQISQY